MRSNKRKFVLGAAVAALACALFALAACSSGTTGTTAETPGPVNVVSKVNFTFENGDGESVTTYTLDAQGNIVKEVYEMTSGSTTASVTDEFTYDEAGNLTGYTLKDDQGGDVTFTGTTEVSGNAPGARTVTENLTSDGDDDATLTYAYEIGSNDVVSKYDNIANTAGIEGASTTTFDENGLPTSFVVTTNDVTTADIAITYEDTEANSLIILTNNAEGSSSEGQNITGVITYEDGKIMQISFDDILGTTITIDYTYETVDNPAALVRSMAPASPFLGNVLNTLSSFVTNA